MRATYTYATVPVSLATITEVERALAGAGYERQIGRDERNKVKLIDMNGLALSRSSERVDFLISDPDGASFFIALPMTGKADQWLADIFPRTLHTYRGNAIALHGRAFLRFLDDSRKDGLAVNYNVDNLGYKKV